MVKDIGFLVRSRMPWPQIYSVEIEIEIKICSIEMRKVKEDGGEFFSHISFKAGMFERNRDAKLDQFRLEGQWVYCRDSVAGVERGDGKRRLGVVHFHFLLIVSSNPYPVGSDGKVT